MNQLIELYKEKIDRLNWYLETNAKYINENERNLVNQRIIDFKEFIYHLGG